jgi:putative hemolysin
MNVSSNKDDARSFSVNDYLPQYLGHFRPILCFILDRLFGLKALTEVYSKSRGLEPQAFCSDVLKTVEVDFTAGASFAEHIPRAGRCLVVANHPHGLLDGVGMIKELLKHRTDVRVMANHLLYCFEELKPVFIGVNPFGGDKAKRFNAKAVIQSVKWLENGGLLVMFPGGEVSSVNLASRNVIDPKWDAGIGWLVRKTNSPVVPLFISGRNSFLFQTAGIIYERLRTPLLVKEFLNHRGASITVDCGPLIPVKTLKLLEDDNHIAKHLRTCTYLLRERTKYKKPFRLIRQKESIILAEAIHESYPAQLLSDEVSMLPTEQCLVSNTGRLQVWYADAFQIPMLLKEIGRLREIAFRNVGEGTGKTEDLDKFDTYYQHLFLWDTEAQVVIGGYRLGGAKKIIAERGQEGLYICTLFKLAPKLKDDLSHALEVGRSFVREEQQKSYSSLMMLWKGIGRYVALHPNYRYLLGPVSISNDYHPLSQQLIVRFLQVSSMEDKRSSLVKPRQPFKVEKKHSRRIDINLSDLGVIENMLSTLEDQDAGIPVILRQYLKLNGQILGFNVDPDFGNSVDCLLWVDLTKTDKALLCKYMGKTGVEDFLLKHKNRDVPNERELRLKSSLDLYEKEKGS